MSKPTKVSSISFGGYGEVFKATDKEGNTVAVKEFSPRGIVNPSDLSKAKQRFKKEILVQQKISKYKATLPILDSNFDDSPPWFSMPLASKNYREQIKEDKLNKKISSDPLMDILSCLEEIHDKGFVHRDLKPENILNYDGKWYLSDFGLVLSADKEVTKKITTTGSAYGTESYMAPEQSNSFSHVTPSADIYSFGCILHDLVDNSLRLIPYQKIKIPGAWSVVIEKCTEVDAKKRFKSIKSLRESVNQVLRKHPTLVPPPEITTWITDLADIKNWDTQKFNDLITAINKEEPGKEDGILAELSYQHLLEIREKNDEAWHNIGEKYSTWIASSFTFSFCDVICDRAVMFFDLSSDLGLKSTIMLGLAHLATKNHRYHVMREFVKRCSHRLPEELAERIQIEFVSSESEYLILECVRDLHAYSKDYYHPALLELIKDP